MLDTMNKTEIAALFITELEALRLELRALTVATMAGKVSALNDISIWQRKADEEALSVTRSIYSEEPGESS